MHTIRFITRKSNSKELRYLIFDKKIKKEKEIKLRIYFLAFLLKVYVPNATATNAMAMMTVAAPEYSGTVGAGVGVASDTVLLVGTKYACRAQTSALAFHETWLVSKVLDVEGAIIQ